MLEGFFALFLFNTIGWYIATILFIIFAFVAMEKETVEFAIVLLIIYIILHGNLVTYVFKQPWYIIVGGVVAYITLSIIWSSIKWWLFVKAVAEELNEEWQRFLKDNDLPADTTELTKKQISSWDSRKTYHRKPLFLENKGKITIWAMYWPLSFIWEFISNFVKNFFKNLIALFRKQYEKIGNHAFKTFDLKVTEKKINIKKKGL